jgi:hypothetical protein
MSKKSAKIRPHEQLVLTIWYLKIIVINNRITLVRIWLKSMGMQRIVLEFNDKLLNNHTQLLLNFSSKFSDSAKMREIALPA